MAPLLHILGFRLGADVDPRHTECVPDAGIGGAEPDGCAKRQRSDVCRLNGDLNAELLEESGGRSSPRPRAVLIHPR
jgi:hypothetical protein